MTLSTTNYICMQDCSPNVNHFFPACGQGTYRRAGDPECVRCPKYSVTHGVAKTNVTECTCLPGFQGNAAAGEDCKRIV